MKKILFILFILIWNILHFSDKTFASSDAWYFVVTAYYSPVPGQKKYLMWDYESEKTLNGEWIRWASWKPVFSWMLAAPKNYRFWTKIKLEWLGVWEVSDRWWAIVNSWIRWYNYDRIDVWVWYWDKWLQRALYWGKRRIKWTIVSTNSKVTFNYNKIPAPTWATKWLNLIPKIFDYWLWIGSNTNLVKELQKLLKEVWLYDWKINWIYNSKLIDIIYKFQINNWLIKSWTSYWAWYWWKATRTLFLKKYLNWEFNNDNNDDKITEKVVVNKSKHNLKIFDWIVNTNLKIKELQKILIELKLYNWKETWIYKDIVGSIYNYQLSKWILSSEYTPWAGNFWPKTRISLKETYNKFLKKNEDKRLEKLRKKEEKTKEEKRKKELEEKYIKLKELSLEKAKNKLNDIWTPKFWEVSSSVRELQNTLKDLWYFEHKDTAIYGNITKQSIISYQLDNNIIKSKNDLWAWIVWPKTKKSIKNDLKELFLNKIAKLEKFDLSKLALIEGNGNEI